MATKKAGATYPFREAAETARRARDAWINYGTTLKPHLRVSYDARAVAALYQALAYTFDQMQDHSDDEGPPPPPPRPARAAK